MVGSFWMLLMNGFNLLPFAILDGGQVVEAITYSVNETFGLSFLAASTVVGVAWLSFHNIFLAMIILYMAGRTVLTQFQGWKIRKEGFGSMIAPLPRKMTSSQVVLSVAGYLTLVCTILLLAMQMYSNPATHTSLF
jgi:membrane-associated protease RseP (regulator of RpoE activity)